MVPSITDRGNRYRCLQRLWLYCFRSDDEAFSANNHLFARFAHLDALLQFGAFLRCQYRTLSETKVAEATERDIGRIIDSHTARER